MATRVARQTSTKAQAGGQRGKKMVTCLFVARDTQAMKKKKGSERRATHRGNPHGNKRGHGWGCVEVEGWRTVAVGGRQRTGATAATRLGTSDDA